MSSVELADRMLCSLAEVNGQRLRNGTISNDDRRKLVEKAAEMSQAPLFVDDTPSRTMTEIAAAARRLKRKSNLGLVVIDYLQLIEPDNATRSAAGASGQDRPPPQGAGPRAESAGALPGPAQSPGRSVARQQAPA